MDYTVREIHNGHQDGCVDRQRVVVIGKHMLRDLVSRLLSGYPDIEVVATEPDAPLTSIIDEAGAQFLIIGNGENELSATCSALLNERPNLRALAVIEDGRDSILFEMRQHSVRLGELSPETLIAVVRKPEPAGDPG